MVNLQHMSSTMLQKCKANYCLYSKYALHNHTFIINQASRALQMLMDPSNSVLSTNCLCSFYSPPGRRDRKAFILHISVRHSLLRIRSPCSERTSYSCWPLQTPLCSYALSPWNGCTELFLYWLNAEHMPGSRHFFRWTLFVILRRI
jgi:hypothetical protein